MSVGDAADHTEALAFYLAERMSSEVDGRVFRPELPEVRDFEMPTSVIVVMPHSRGKLMAGTRSQAIDHVVDILCYGESRQNSDNLSRQVETYLDLLRMAVVPCSEADGNVLLYWCRIAGGPTPRVEGNALWPFSELTIQCLHSRYVLA
jgi:hypothetical protein